MTCIIFNCRTKGDLKKAADDVNKGKGTRVYFEDPSIFNPRQDGTLASVKEGEHIVVTNHPRRSWFAEITRRRGLLVVS